MIRIKNKKNCCGCEACIQVCPKHCISFQQDSQGFYYPLVDISCCVNCGLCSMVCPILNVKEYHIPSSTPVYGTYNQNPNQRATSSSGGIFELLATNVISKKGVVFGAVFDEEWNVKHAYAEDLSQIQRLKRSKYVQSRIGRSYTDVRRFLKQEKLVLFVGTPCQIAGLKGFLRKDYENLITVDVVCHGVPSPMIWQKYINEQKQIILKKNGNLKCDSIKITAISFRDKVESWRRYHLSYTYKVMKDGIDAIGPDSIGETFSEYVWENDYMLSFLHDYANRPSCFECKFRDGKCHSDLTLADFWGIENLTQEKELIGEKGTSLVMAHTSKGANLLTELPCSLREFPFTKSFVGNPAVFHNWSKPITHDLFFKLCKNTSLRQAFEKAHKIQLFFQPSLKIAKRIRNKINRIWQK